MSDVTVLGYSCGVHKDSKDLCVCRRRKKGVVGGRGPSTHPLTPPRSCLRVDDVGDVGDRGRGRVDPVDTRETPVVLVFLSPPRCPDEWYDPWSRP